MKPLTPAQALRSFRNLFASSEVADAYGEIVTNEDPIDDRLGVLLSDPHPRAAADYWIRLGEIAIERGDALKADVPVWKREGYVEGAHEWVPGFTPVAG